MNLPARWEAASRNERGTISDISVTGCFMLTGGETMPGEAVHVALELPKDRIIELRGEVVYLTEEIGFAVRFTSEDAGRTQLVKFLNLIISKRRASAPAEG
ncbi:MAG: PilZ domain-containing protein [Rubrivivax sp.]|nr:PilZ domain-containing protein [Pyrinomonadaceae bacterium]